MAKATYSIEITDEGSFIFLIDEHSQKAYLHIEVTDEGISNTTSESDEHPSKESIPIEITDEGIVI